MRRAVSRPCGRAVARGIESRRRRAIRHDDWRGLIVIAEMYADRREMLDLRRQLRRDGGARRLARGAGLLERRRLGEDLAASVVIVGGFQRVAEPDRTPLALIAGEQLRSAPA